MVEIWEKVKDFDNYIVSNKGNVINTKFGILKKQRNTKTGYKIIDLKENGKKKTEYIHRLVAEAFNINAMGINYCIKGKQKTAAGYRWGVV